MSLIPTKQKVAIQQIHSFIELAHRVKINIEHKQYEQAIDEFIFLEKAIPRQKIAIENALFFDKQKNPYKYEKK